MNAWLRSKGITANKPLHELRKELGALIATEQGIYAASRFLRHSDISTTARHYADHKARISVGLRANTSTHRPNLSHNRLQRDSYSNKFSSQNADSSDAQLMSGVRAIFQHWKDLDDQPATDEQLAKIAHP